MKRRDSAFRRMGLRATSPPSDPGVVAGRWQFKADWQNNQAILLPSSSVDSLLTHRVTVTSGRAFWKAAMASEVRLGQRKSSSRLSDFSPIR